MAKAKPVLVLVLFSTLLTTLVGSTSYAKAPEKNSTEEITIVSEEAPEIISALPLTYSSSTDLLSNKIQILEVMQVTEETIEETSSEETELSATEETSENVETEECETTQLHEEDYNAEELEESTSVAEWISETIATEEAAKEAEEVEETFTESETYNEEATTSSWSGTFTLTAYCSCSYCCGAGGGTTTATGTTPTAGRTIAVDPSVIPYGSTVEINGNYYIAEDTGGAIDGMRIDVYFDNHQAALEFGRQTITCTVYPVS